MTGCFAVYPRPRAKATAQEHLRRQDYKVSLPRHVKRRRHARLTDFVSAPHIPRYLFVAIDKLRQRWRPPRVPRAWTSGDPDTPGTRSNKIRQTLPRPPLPTPLPRW